MKTLKSLFIVTVAFAHASFLGSPIHAASEAWGTPPTSTFQQPYHSPVASSIFSLGWQPQLPNNYDIHRFTPTFFHDQVLDLPHFDIGEVNETLFNFKQNSLTFEKGFQLPVSFTETLHRGDHPIFIRKRSSQILEKNPGYERFQSAKHQLDQRTTTGVDPEKLKSIKRLPPPKELVRGYTEQWDNVITGEKTDIEITKMDYQNDRWLSGIEGSVQSGESTISFVKSIDYGLNGEPVSASAKLRADGAPGLELSWQRQEGVDPTTSLQMFNQTFQGLLQSHGQVETNMVPIRLNESGELSFQGLKTNQAGLTIKALPVDESSKAGFSFKNAVRNVWYFLTGRWSEVKGLRRQLTQSAKNKPSEFLLSAGFRDPSYLSIKELKSAVTSQKELGSLQSQEKKFMSGWDLLNAPTKSSINQAKQQLKQANQQFDVVKVQAAVLDQLVDHVGRQFESQSNPEMIQALSSLKIKEEAMKKVISPAKAIQKTGEQLDQAIKEHRFNGVAELANNFQASVQSLSQQVKVLQRQVKSKVVLVQTLVGGAEQMGENPANALVSGNDLITSLKSQVEKGTLSEEQADVFEKAITTEMETQSTRFLEAFEAEQAIKRVEFLEKTAEGMAEGAVKGDIIKDPSLENIAGQVGVSFTPAGFAADVRDITANFIRSGSTGFKDHKIELALSFIGLIPVTKELVKLKKHGYIGEAANKTKKAVKNLGELFRKPITFKDKTGGIIFREKLSFKTLLAKAKFLFGNSPRPTAQIQKLLHERAPPPKVLARIIVGDGLEKYGTLGKSRPVSFVFDPAEVAGLSPKEILTKVGWTEKQITKSAGKKVTLSFFEMDTKNFVVEVPTWDSVKKMAKSDPEFVSFLKEKGLYNKFDSLFEKVRLKDNKFNADKSAKLISRELSKKYAINDLFSGRGFTKTSDSNFGVREWWIRKLNDAKNQNVQWNHEPFNGINIHNLGSL